MGRNLIKNVTLDEANKVFKVWKQWYSFHIILHSIFLSRIPESFLPYPQTVLEEALNIIAKHYHDSGDYNATRNIEESICSLVAYVKDDDALQSATELFQWRCNEQKAKKAFFISIDNFKKDWGNWLDKQEK
jgi:hypothetical protein